MSRWVTPLLLVAAMACATAPPAPQPAAAGTQDGRSCETAIAVTAKNEREGISAEYAWIKQHYPGSKRGGQALTQCNGKAVDRIDFTDGDGNKLTVYFDISGWLGKY